MLKKFKFPSFFLAIIIISYFSKAVADSVSLAKKKEAKEQRTEQLLSTNELIQAIKAVDEPRYYQIIDKLSPLSDNPYQMKRMLVLTSELIQALAISKSQYADDQTINAYYDIENKILKNFSEIDKVWCGRMSKGVSPPYDVVTQIQQTLVDLRGEVLIDLIRSNSKAKPINQAAAANTIDAITEAMYRKYGEQFLEVAQGAYNARELSLACSYTIEFNDRLAEFPKSMRVNVYRFLLNEMRKEVK